MESPSRALIFTPPSQRHCSSISSSSNNNNDSLSLPEFEFWNLSRNNPEPFISPLHSADQLFSHGFLLPLQVLPIHRFEPDVDHEPVSNFNHGTVPGPSITSSQPSALITSEYSSSGNPILTASKRWREIFKRTEKKITSDNNDNNNNSEEIIKKVDKKRGKQRKNITRPGSAELNINIWPFSRSRSAGNNSIRSNKPAQSNRKVNSAPCSRSNSWPSSPSRGGIYLGRASPIWQVKRAGPPHETGKGSVLNLNVPVMSCRSYENNAVKSGGRNGNLFGFRGLFSKKSSSSSTTVLTV